MGVGDYIGELPGNYLFDATNDKAAEIYYETCHICVTYCCTYEAQIIHYVFSWYLMDHARLLLEKKQEQQILMDDDSNSQTNDQEDTPIGGGSRRQKRRCGTGVADYTGELMRNYLFDV